MKNLKIIATIAFIATLSSCVNGDDYGGPDEICVSIDKTKEVSAITNIATGTPEQYTTDLELVDYIEAYVTSSDEGGNIYKSISMMSLDGLKGFSMPVDNYNLYTEFEPGRKVTIKLDNSVYYNKQQGSTVIGALFSGNVGRLSGIQYKDVILRSCEKVDEESIVKHLTIAQAKNDQYLNMLIEFDAVQFADASVGKTYFDKTLNPVPTFTATNHNIRDASGNTITVRISEFANFATKKVATGNGKIRGVLTKFSGAYQFMVRTEKDIQLTGDRIDTTIPTDPIDPTAPTNLLFAGSDFENFTTLNTSLNSFGLQPYATQGIGTGALGTNSLYLNGTAPINEYVFTALAASHGTIPANPTKITFWVKGTSAKSLSINITRSTGGYDVFNLDNLSTTAVVLNKTALNTNGNGNGVNSYTGNINTNGQWVKITLNITGITINSSNTGDMFALKVGKDALYNLHIDNIEIQ
ncbi:DUF5689 domain-containing protein [Flavobacterium ardleyense]|uniref:DUF5689 domain-containing protein n=1 Tax=Flavobacterium ardleyense TaxID=2038737 RepID=A0ABW5Z865_9FLAO